MQSIVYLFNHENTFWLALHVPQHDALDWREHTLRSIVGAFAFHIPNLDMPIATLHYLPTRTYGEMTLANTGNPSVFDMLREKATKPDAFQKFKRAALRKLGSEREGDSVRCARVTVEYSDETDLFECSEEVSYLDVSLHPMCARLLQFCESENV